MRRLAFLAAVVMGWCALPAHAGPPPQAELLCSDAPRGCAITVADTLREGATFPVTVQGRPQTRVQVVAYQAVVDEQGTLQDLVPLGDGVEVLTGSAGVVSADLPIPAVVTDESSGWALVSVASLTGTDTSLTVGEFAPFGARRPTVLGDGFGERKPVGEPLDLSLMGAIHGSRYAVEYRDDDDVWHDITVGDGAATGAPDEPSVVRYQLPRGLRGMPYQVRLRNISDSAIAALWLAVPAADGDPAPPRQRFVPPPVGDALDGTSPLAAHPTALVRGVGYGIAGVCTVFVLGATACSAVTRRRRRGGAA